MRTCTAEEFTSNFLKMAKASSYNSDPIAMLAEKKSLKVSLVLGKSVASSRSIIKVTVFHLFERNFTDKANTYQYLEHRNCPVC